MGTCMHHVFRYGLRAGNRERSETIRTRYTKVFRGREICSCELDKNGGIVSLHGDASERLINPDPHVQVHCERPQKTRFVWACEGVEETKASWPKVKTCELEQRVVRGDNLLCPILVIGVTKATQTRVTMSRFRVLGAAELAICETIWFRDGATDLERQRPG